MHFLDPTSDIKLIKGNPPAKYQFKIINRFSSQSKKAVQQTPESMEGRSVKILTNYWRTLKTLELWYLGSFYPCNMLVDGWTIHPQIFQKSILASLFEIHVMLFLWYKVCIVWECLGGREAIYLWRLLSGKHLKFSIFTTNNTTGVCELSITLKKWKLALLASAF